MAEEQKKDTVVSLQIQAGSATPAPPVGTVLGPTGINMQQFCQEFNDRTKDQKATGFKLTTVITINKKREYKFIVKTPLTSALIKDQAGVKKGSQLPPSKVGQITMAQVEEIAKIKLPDLTAGSIEAARRIVIGSAKSMGIEVVEA